MCLKSISLSLSIVIMHNIQIQKTGAEGGLYSPDLLPAADLER